MDADGYPDDEELREIAEWQPHPDTGFHGAFEFIVRRWWHSDWGVGVKGRKIWMSTGGWSGNESLISAMQQNYLLWSTCWISSRKGGHFVFEMWRPKKRRARVKP